MQNENFGAEYLESMDSPSFGGRVAARQQCHTNYDTGLIDCSWILYRIDL